VLKKDEKINKSKRKVLKLWKVPVLMTLGSLVKAHHHGGSDIHFPGHESHGHNQNHKNRKK